MSAPIRNLIRALGLLMCLALTASADPVWNSVNSLRPTSVARDTAGVLYAAAAFGVDRSSDGGMTWETLPTDTNLATGFSIIVNPLSNDIIVAVESGVYRSSDEGVTWIRLTNQIVGTYAMGARGDGLLIATGSMGFWRSIDNGDTWTMSDNLLGPMHDGIAFSAYGTCFVGSLLDGLYRSTDDGQTWEYISAPFGEANQLQDVVVDTVNDYVYATAFHQFYQTPTYNKVFRSDDDGVTWTQVDSVGGISLSMGIDSHGNVYSARQPTARSTDHGATWTDISSGVDQGNRLVGFLEAAPGIMLLADMDDSMKIAYFDPGVLCGDIDGSGAIDIADVVFLVAFLFQGGPAPTPLSVGDMDGVSGISVSDLVYLVANLFQGGPAPTCP